jgi:hypothetical protein
VFRSSPGKNGGRKTLAAEATPLHTASERVVIDPIVEIAGVLAFIALIAILAVSAHGAARKPDPDDYPIQSDPRPWDVLGGGRD